MSPLKICFAFFLLISSYVSAGDINLPPVSASIIFTNQAQLNNMSFGNDNNPVQEGYTIATTFAGTECRKIPAGKFLYISCSRTAVPTTTKHIIITITYYDSSLQALWMNYTRNGTGWGNADFKKTNTKKWITRIITLTDAGLNNSMGYNGDIRMGFGNEDNYIKDISIHVGTLNPDAEPLVPKVNNPAAEFTGKSFAGYQLWHEAGNRAMDWSHWAYGKLPAAGRGNHNTETFPFLADFEDNPAITLYPTNFANLGNGKPARLYNSTDRGVIDVQMDLLKRGGVSGVAIQRNAPVGRALKSTADDYCVDIKKACEATGRLFYIMYCMPDANNGTVNLEDVVEGIKRDWVYQMEQVYELTKSGAYATYLGKPVVELWGLGYSSILIDKTQALALAAFFKSRGCYVIAGTPRDWRLRNEGSRTDFEEVYKAYNMISPWTVGAYGDIAGANNYKNNYMIADKTYCSQNNLEYYPVVFAGGGWSQHVSGYPNDAPRLGGKFLWQQALNIRDRDIPFMYIAMLDEYEESTNIMSSAVDYFDIPTDQYFGTQSMDGIWTSPDYYLRLVGAATEMIGRSRGVTTDIPITYSNGPVYYRNSFESRVANCIINGTAQDFITPIDPRFYNAAVLLSTAVTNPSVAIVNEPAFSKSGKYSVKLNGRGTGNAQYYYKTAETKIAVKANMQLSFWKYTVNNEGRYSTVGLAFKSGKTLRSLPVYTDDKGNNMHPSTPRGSMGNWQKITCQVGKGELIGDEITAISIEYDNQVTTGSFSAYFDDIIIEDALNESCSLATSVTWMGTINSAWENPANWSCGAVPDSSSVVVINGGLVNYPVINSHVVCKSIINNAGASLKINEGYSLTLRGQ
ncbi:MAG: glycoside hydrolase family 71/99-like protein [Ferruginibacter sp.]